MTKRFELRLCSNGIYYVYENGTLTDIDFDKFNRESAYALIDEVNALYEEKEQLKHRIEELRKELSNCEEDYNMQDMEIKALRKELHLVHMSSMFSTVKSFKGDISKRYKYSAKTDMIYDTANHYGKYDKILDKKEVTMLLNEYNTLLEESNEE